MDKMNQEDYRLLNFKISPEVKNQFHKLCRSKRSNMTSELNRMIDEFININGHISTYEGPSASLNNKGTRNL